MARDNFLMPIKKALASRAGNHCSFPGCPVVTDGPSEESDTATANSGTAAHIAGASAGSGSRRYDPNMSTDKRRSYENGIWCCRTHGTLIDTDEVTFSVEMLKKWKELAVKKAALRQAHGEIQFNSRPELYEIGLAPDTLIISDPDFQNQVIGNAVRYSCVGLIWGKHIEDSLRDFIIESARNSFEHGGASRIKIGFTKYGVLIEDDGKSFNIHKLSASGFGRGGGLAYRELLSQLNIGALSVKTTIGVGNILHIPLVRNIEDLVDNNPCVVALNHSDLRINNQDFSVYESCNRIFVVTPNFMSFSDGPLCESVLEGVLKHHENVVLVIPNASNAVLRNYQQRFFQVEVMSWN